LTPARVGLGRAGAGLPTEALLAFTLDHARARDAVHASFDTAGLMSGFRELALAPLALSSRAPARRDYLRRPDLGRMLDEESRRLLQRGRGGACDVALVVGDGLSPAAVNRHAVEFARHLLPRLAREGIAIGQTAIACGARVALGDEIGEILSAKMMVMLIGERPGLSAPDSLGAYLTYAPKGGCTDAMRNCVSNIHGAGLSSEEAAFKVAWLIREGLQRQITGVSLKDESGDAALQRIEKPV
jgi:ethanolamine ammonia-lyase small subunit